MIDTLTQLRAKANGINLPTKEELQFLAKESGMPIEEIEIMLERALAVAAGDSAMFKSFKSSGGFSKLANALKSAKERHIVQSDGKQGSADMDEEDEREKSVDPFTSTRLNAQLHRLLEGMVMTRTKQIGDVQAHLNQNRVESIRNLFASVATLPEDERIQARFKEIEGQSEGYRDGLYDMFTSDKLNMRRTRNSGMQVTLKESLAQQTSIENAAQAKQDAALRQFYAQQALIHTPEQRRQAAVEWRTHKL